MMWLPHVMHYVQSIYVTAEVGLCGLNILFLIDSGCVKCTGIS